MIDKQLIQIAQKQGFNAVVVSTKDIAVDYGFRKFCEDNLCGKYGANYSCPPDCGTPQQVHEKLLSKNTALVLQKICPIKGYNDKETIQQAKASVNRDVLKVLDKMIEAGYKPISLGYNGCPLCNPCKRTLNQPCAFPERKISCISAYCIDVAKLAQLAQLEFCWSEENLYLFGMILFDK